MIQSRTITPQPIPLSWKNAFDWNNSSCLEFLDWLIKQNHVVRDEWLGKFVDLRERAALGLLSAGKKEIRGIARYPELFELRWSQITNSETRIIRQYHAEPESAPEILVALHLHLKQTDGEATDIRHWQNTEIDFAHRRFKSCLQKGWNL